MGYRLFYALQYLFCLRNVQEGYIPELSLCPMCRTFGSVCPILLEQASETQSGGTVLSLVAYGLGTICTLKCEHCAEGIPYVPIEKRAFVPIDIVKKDITRLADACDYIVRLDFCGGEPLTHPHIDEIINCSLEIKNIGSFYVITNGTVVPSNEICVALRNPRIKVIISDYTGQLSARYERNIVKTIEKLTEAGVAVEQRRNLVWSDMNSFESRGLSMKQMENAYESCLLVNSRRLHNGILYPCLHYFAGVQTGKIMCDPNECLHIHDVHTDKLSEAIQKYLHKTFVSACDCCMAPFDALEVPAAQQAKKGIQS